MKFQILFAAIFFLLGETGFAQNIAINTNGDPADISALLDLSATNKGMLIPRVQLTSSADAVTIATPAASLLVYNQLGGGLTPEGYYYNSGTTVAPVWVQLLNGGSAAPAWLTLGNAGTVDGTNFLGTTDDVPLNFRVNNEKSGRIVSTGATFLGYQAGNSNLATGTTNTGIGYQALFTNTADFFGGLNTAMGYVALRNNTTGGANTAIGVNALKLNITGNQNTALGVNALGASTAVDANTAIGYNALNLNTTGSGNTATGHNALAANTTGFLNTAIGQGALAANTVAESNTAVGWWALVANTAARRNTAIGVNALQVQGTFTNGGVAYDAENVAVGYVALQNNQPTFTGNGIQNTALGSYALLVNTTGWGNTAVGWQALVSNNTTGTNNTAIGRLSGVSANGLSYATAIGAGAVAAASNNMILGGVSSGSASVNVGIGTNALVTNARLAIKDGHFQVQQTTDPTIAATPYVTFSLTNATDVAGKVSVTTTAAIGTVTITFNKTYTTAPVVTLTPTNAVAAAEMVSAKVYVTSTVNDFTINFGAAPSAVAHTFNYQIIETR